MYSRALVNISTHSHHEPLRFLQCGMFLCKGAAADLGGMYGAMSEALPDPCVVAPYVGGARHAPQLRSAPLHGNMPL